MNEYIASTDVRDVQLTFELLKRKTKYQERTKLNFQSTTLY